MRASYTISIINCYGGAMRQWAIAKSALAIIAGLALVAFIAVVIAGGDYIHLRQKIADQDALNERIAAQHHLITQQRHQIQSFAEDLNNLKGRLVAIGDFEKRIRVIANLDNTPDSAGLFGMGGAAPEDLNANLPLEAAHGTLIRDMHAQANQLDAATDKQTQQISALLRDLEDQIDHLAATPSIRPAKGWVTSRFGKRASPFTGRPEFHPALDIAGDLSTPILATGNGTVSFSGKKWLLGNVIVIDHGYGMFTRYAHCEILLKKPGDTVKRGDIIAHMGNTGRSTGPHVHYEVRLNGVPVNPERYILN